MEDFKESVDEMGTLLENTPQNNCEKKCGCNRRILCIVLGCILGAAILAVGVLAYMGKFSKYPGFKKDRNTGLYYKFYGEIHDSTAMPKTGDLVGILFSLRTSDSTLLPMIPNEMLMDSIYECDFYAALRMMHVGDSATFVFDGNRFFEHFFQGQEYPFGEEPLYADIKLYGHMNHDLFVQKQAEYEQLIKSKQGQEDSLTQNYLDQHKELKKRDEGIYMVTTKKGNGTKAETMQNVTVHYTGRLLDGTVFDSSVERGTPFTFTLGAGQVIPGWEIALSLMSVGEKATVLIPSALAYGERGMQVIPPYSPLVFDIEFISAED